jgi:hypothetical protein
MACRADYLRQVLADGPAYSTHYGKLWGGLIMLVAITKVRRGPVGIMAGITFVGAVIYNFWLKR